MKITMLSMWIAVVAICLGSLTTACNKKHQDQSDTREEQTTRHPWHSDLYQYPDTKYVRAMSGIIEDPHSIQCSISEDQETLTCSLKRGAKNKEGVASKILERQPKLTPPIKQVSVGGYHVCALDAKSIHCWGADLDKVILTVPELENPRMVSAGGIHTCAIDDHGGTCWGLNMDKQISFPSDARKQDVLQMIALPRGTVVTTRTEQFCMGLCR